MVNFTAYQQEQATGVADVRRLLDRGDSPMFLAFVRQLPQRSDGYRLGAAQEMATALPELLRRAAA